MFNVLIQGEKDLLQGVKDKREKGLRHVAGPVEPNGMPLVLVTRNGTQSVYFTPGNISFKKERLQVKGEVQPRPLSLLEGWAWGQE